MFSMLSLEDIAIVKIASEICNDSELKREILCASDDAKKKHDEYERKQHWDQMLEIKATAALRNRGFPKKLQKKVVGLVFAIGMRMLTWAEYHERIIGFSREHSVNFFNSAFCTQQGLIDSKKAAEELMNNKNLSIGQKYKLACLYCFIDHIPALYREMTKEDKEKFYSTIPERTKQPELVKFWTYYLMGEVHEIIGEKTIDLYRLEKAVESGCKTAVEYFLEKINLREKKNAIAGAALEALRYRIAARYDWVVFRNRTNNQDRETWVPSNYYVDIVSFLLSKMREDQQIEFLKNDIESRVLDCFLSWPYQKYFMKTAKLMWDFLQERNYSIILLKICGKIEPEKNKNLKYGEEKNFDYRGFLKEFWYQSPERYKRYVLSNRRASYTNDSASEGQVGLVLLSKLLALKSFTYEDGQIIGIILASASDEEKKNIIYSREIKLFYINICIKLIKEEKWVPPDKLPQNYFSSEKEAGKFKRKNDKWNTDELFQKWDSLPEEERNQIKKEMIYSDDGKRACNDLNFHKEIVAVANNIFKWCFSSAEQVREFKKKLIFSDLAVNYCQPLIQEDKFELVDKFITWCLFSAEKIKEFKNYLANSIGDFICINLISEYSEEEIYVKQRYTVGRTAKFKGGKWEEVDNFLNWCFSSKEEISDFKKNIFLTMSGKEIHFNLIKSRQYEEAEIFFAWLGLSAEEVKKLKKEALFLGGAASEMFRELMLSEEGDGRFVDYGSKQEAIEQLLRWYLTDIETVLEFKNEFKSLNRYETALIKSFDLMIDKRLMDFEKKPMLVERKPETFSSSRRPCNLKLGNKGAKYGK